MYRNVESITYAVHPGRAMARGLAGLLIALLALSQPLTALAAPASTGETCVLACNAKTCRCSYFGVGTVPRGFRVQRAAPPGYKIVKSGSPCDNRICSTSDRSVCGISPIGQATTAVDR